MSRFSELQAFVRVAEAGSMTKAAERLEVAKSAVSRRVSELEDSSFKARRIAATRQVVCASASYLETHGRPETPADLTKHRCLVCALYPPTRFLSRRVREFVDFLSDRFAGVPCWQRCLER